jgi:hypothetical protein
MQITNVKNDLKLKEEVKIMRKVKRIWMMSVLGFLSVVLVFSLSFVQAQIKPKAGPVDTEKLQKPIPIPLPDLVVTGIYGARCPDCGCGRTNFGNHPLVEYLEDIQVNVKNQGRAASGPCTLTIELFDVVGSRRAVINKNIPGLNAGQSLSVQERGEFLFRKSDEIRATIDSTRVVIESNEGNNSMTIRDCTVYFI